MVVLWHPIGALYCILGLSIMFGDWLLQKFNILISNNKRRLLTGMVAGYSIMSAYFLVFAHIK